MFGDDTNYHYQYYYYPQDAPQEDNMLMDAIRWNMLNVVRVEMLLNAWKIWKIFRTSSLQSTHGQYAIASLVITVLAQLTIQFNVGLLLTLYSIYLGVGMFVWLHRRVYFYHRRLDASGVLAAIQHFDTTSSKTINTSLAAAHAAALGTLKHSKNSSNGTSSSAASTSQASSSTSGASTTTTTTNALGNGFESTNSLQRQRVSAYRDFQRVLSEPRRNHKEFALSLSHLSHLAKLVADKDVMDEMHFQILATRRDVVNILLRFVLVCAATFLANLR